MELGAVVVRLLCNVVQKTEAGDGLFLLARLVVMVSVVTGSSKVQTVESVETVELRFKRGRHRRAQDPTPFPYGDVTVSSRSPMTLEQVVSVWLSVNGRWS